VRRLFRIWPGPHLSSCEEVVQDFGQDLTSVPVRELFRIWPGPHLNSCEEVFQNFGQDLTSVPVRRLFKILATSGASSRNIRHWQMST
jgi:hypothetical protein